MLISGWESPALHLKTLLSIRDTKSTRVKFELPVRRLVEPFSSLLFIYLQVIMAFSIEATTKHYMSSSHYQIWRNHYSASFGHMTICIFSSNCTNYKVWKSIYGLLCYRFQFVICNLHITADHWMSWSWILLRWHRLTFAFIDCYFRPIIGELWDETFHTFYSK